MKHMSTILESKNLRSGLGFGDPVRVATYKDQLRESRVPEWEKKRAGSVKSDAKQASNAEKSSEQRKMEASNGANPRASLHLVCERHRLSG